MKEVTKDEFYAAVGNLDAIVNIANPANYPYTSEFTLRHSRKLLGKVVDGYTDDIPNQYPTVSRYYLHDDLCKEAQRTKIKAL